MARVLSARFDDTDMERLIALQSRLQERAEPHITVTQRLTILRALDALERELDRSDRDKGRKR